LIVNYRTYYKHELETRLSRRGSILSVALQTIRFWHSAARWFFGFAAPWLSFHLGASLPATAFAHLILIVLLPLIGSFVPLAGLCPSRPGSS